MRRGDVVSAKNIRAVMGKGWMEFKAPKGSRFVFIMLGVETDESPLDPTEALHALGWVVEPELDAILTAGPPAPRDPEEKHG